MVLRAFDIAFDEIIIPLRTSESRARVLDVSPSGKVPALITPDQTVWESLAIIEYIADHFPDKAIWPTNRKIRAHARSISNEMHGGFQTIRAACPMNLGARYATPEMTVPLLANVARIEDIWDDARRHRDGDGPYLYGAFSAADAMYAPIASRLDTYQIPVRPETRDYIDTILGHAAFVEWRDAALKETWSIDNYDAGHTLVQSFR